mmetsp:Transcript_13622/g.36202  ORF Transcript_13622/g.36202 Transcript_13622/m.36202 type:complete len:302 (+) Transcript_13622:261-1166(+)
MHCIVCREGLVTHGQARCGRCVAHQHRLADETKSCGDSAGSESGAMHGLDCGALLRGACAHAFHGPAGCWPAGVGARFGGAATCNSVSLCFLGGGAFLGAAPLHHNHCAASALGLPLCVCQHRVLPLGRCDRSVHILASGVQPLAGVHDLYHRFLECDCGPLVPALRLYGRFGTCRDSPKEVAWEAAHAPRDDSLGCLPTLALGAGCLVHRVGPRFGETVHVSGLRLVFGRRVASISCHAGRAQPAATWRSQEPLGVRRRLHRLGGPALARRLVHTAEGTCRRRPRSHLEAAISPAREGMM